MTLLATRFKQIFTLYVPPFDMPLDEVREELDRIRGPLRIAVQRSKNPFNVGAIIRVAHSFLVREIMLIGEEPYYKRASMGMEKYEHISSWPDEAAFLRHVQEQKLRLIVFEKDAPHVRGLWDCPFPEEGCVFVFGSENHGATAELLEAAEQVVAIPMYGINHSYPVSVAAGIAMAEWARRYYGPGRHVNAPRG